MRVLQAPVNIANQPWLMAQGLRQAGHEVEVWQFREHPFGYPVDRTVDVTAGPLAILRTLMEAVEQGFDVVHFHYASSLVPQREFLPWFWDLPVWRSLGVTVVFTFHGSDARLRSHHIADDTWSYYRFADVPCDEDLITTRLAVIRRYASHMTVGSVLDLPYVDEGVYVPKIVDTDGIRVGAPPDRARAVVAHAPSRRSTKGTDIVLQSLDTLREEGVPFDLDLIEGVSNAEALARMGRADIVVEKLLGGDAGVTSLEAMALGRVAVARIRDQVRERHPAMPVVSASPDTFLDVMRGLLTDPERRVRLGQEGRQYVETEHSPAVVGRLLEELYRSPGRPGIPAFPDWTVPPTEAALEVLRTRLEKERAERVRLRGRTKELRGKLQVKRAELLEAQQEIAALKRRTARGLAGRAWRRAVVRR
ncbi:glycosyltransferase family 4 protein [Nocardioides sp. WS12]|uniref:glycosyltransferase family 4 protein n=1 Tax=Nocardioides sp. WS12 TaxID=2486272 RepID=UPI0015FB102A|nr:glycosyltransferase family 4 protein [Nocardioides sp. WS12]